MPSHSATHSQRERQSLADALLAAGPDAPTLCTGWTARDLAAHLVTREWRPDVALTNVVPLLAGWGDRELRRYARRPHEQLVATFRSGPPLLGWSNVPRVDATLNFAEFFVHHEDVRRGGADPTPRVLPEELERQVWRAAVGASRFFFRRSGSGVTLAWPAAGKERLVRKGGTPLVLRGQPAELLLYAYGRRGAATVDVEGPDDAVAAFKALKLGL